MYNNSCAAEYFEFNKCERDMMQQQGMIGWWRARTFNQCKAPNTALIDCQMNEDLIGWALHERVR